MLTRLIAAGVLVAGITAGLPNAAATRPGEPAVRANPADGVLNQAGRTLDFDHGWKFQLVNTADVTDPTGRYGTSDDPHAAAPGFDDSAWRSVTLPHDWAIEQQPSAANSNATGYFPGGLGWYRKTFTLPRSMAGKAISVDFDGVYMNSYVYLNGQLLGNHPYGYTGFSFDLTGKAHTDGHTPNVLAVVVQSKEPNSRWYSGAGITRNVHLTVTDPIHLARWGVSVTTPDLADTIKDGYAKVHVQTDVVNPDGTPVTVIQTVRDAQGRTVSATQGTELRIGHPHLWSTDDPYLYTLHTEVVARHRLVDRYDTTFGLRWLTFDPNGGVFLNGRHLKLQGVDLHNDQGALGSVDNYDALWRQMSILKNEGVNAFRTSHNPPSPEMIDVCQRLGIVMMVEAFDAWNQQKLPNDYHLYFNEWSDRDIAEMVNEAKNSPAVIMWSIGNEIPNWGTTAALPIEQRLIADIKAIDTTRPIVAGSDRYRSLPAPGSISEQMLLNLDGLGLNYNPALVVDGLHARYPTKFFFESESSSEESARGVYQDPDYINTGENYTPGKRLPSSYDNNLASWTMSDEYGLKKDRDRQYFAGQFIWSGFDYLGEPTPYSQFPVKVSSFGTIDTAGFPKDAYYAFQSQWTSTPMVHLVPMNWTDYQPGQNVEVWADSNAPTVELFLNGRSLGAKSFDAKTSTDGVHYLETTECSKDDKNYTGGTCPGSYQSPNGSSGKLHLTWHVPFQPGQLVAVARDDHGHAVARDEVDTAGSPYTVRMTPDKTVLAADGKALSYLTADVVDQHGVVVPDADNAITFQVSGAGTFAGADNGKQDSAEGYRSSTHTAFNGKVLAIVQAGERPGPISITATSPGLTPTTATLYSVDSHVRGLVATEPVYVRTPVGTTPRLPSTVTAVYADGRTAAQPVRWHKARLDGPGTYVINGSNGARAVVTVYAVAGVEPYSTVTPVGDAPFLPRVVTLRYTDGVAQSAAVTWDALVPARYAAPGEFTVSGSVAGTPTRATAQVRVSADFAPGQNIARAGSPTMPSADAGYSGAPNEVPAGLQDGNTASGGWSNFYNKSATNTLPAVSLAHASEWVSLRWPSGQRISTLVPYFTVSSNRVLPSSVQVTYWNGASWVPVSNQHVQFAAASNQPTTISFDPISTTAVRLTMTSPAPNTPTGFLQLTELQVPADELTAPAQ
jgi:beta-galactosidase